MIKELLLVDDDSDDVSFFKEALQDVNPTIAFHTAKNGVSAMGLLHPDQIIRPGLIFLDLNMPVMNGWECLSELKKHEGLRQIPVVMYSTTAMQPDIDKALKLGALALYRKPERFQELKQLLDTAITRAAQVYPS